MNKHLDTQEIIDTLKKEFNLLKHVCKGKLASSLIDTSSLEQLARSLEEDSEHTQQSA